MTTTTSGTTGSARRELVPSRRVRELSESVTLAITARAKALRAAGQDVIGFGAGEPDFRTPAHVVEAAQRACADLAMHRYSPTPGCRRCARRSPGSRAGLGPAGPARRGARQQRLEACAVQRLPGIARPR